VALWLAEIDHGPDEGRPETAVVARIGAEALAAWERDAVPPSDWRVAAEVRMAAWRGLLLASDDGSALVFTSGGAARFAPLALGMRPAGGLKLRTGAYGVIEDGRLVAWDLRPE
jgi:probable phosphoglycerate mutase